MKDLLPELKKGTKKALDALILMRQKEGEELELDIKKRLKAIDKLGSFIEKKAPEAVQKYKERLKLKNLDEKELNVFVERSDITEEITRLKSHLKQFFSFLILEEPVGRMLDFLTLEMLRESSTIIAKSVDEKIAWEAMAMKQEMERIREQVQNIE